MDVDQINEAIARRLYEDLPKKVRLELKVLSGHGTEEDRIKVADLVRLPENMRGDTAHGTRCDVCKFVSGDHCDHKLLDVDLKYGANEMCCAYWDAEGVERDFSDDTPIEEFAVDDHLAEDSEEHVDSRQVHALLKSAQDEGSVRLERVVESALTRLLAREDPLQAKRLFDEDELDAMADSFEKTIGTAEMLGRARIRVREGVEKRKGIESSEATPFSELPELIPAPGHNCLEHVSFAEPLKPLAPAKAVDMFGKLVPKLNRFRGKVWKEGVGRTAFTLAVNTSKEVLDKVKDVIRDRLRDGQTTGPQDVKQVLGDAGVTVDDGYAKMVFRTNAASAYNAGAQEEMREVASAFPVWQYANPKDHRSRATHAARDGKYYSVEKRFEEVRGTDIGDVANCRCTFVPISAREWAKLQAKGAVLS